MLSLRLPQNGFLTLFLSLHDILDHGEDQVPQLVRGAGSTPAISLQALLLRPAALLDRLPDAGQETTQALLRSSRGSAEARAHGHAHLSTSKSQSW